MFHSVLTLVWFLCCWGTMAVNRNENVQCSLRLVEGDGRCRGELQIQKKGQDWAGVDPFHFALRFGHRACAEMNCGSALAMRKKKVSQRGALNILPNRCEDTALSHCFTPILHPTNYIVELNCSDSVRLVSGRSLCSGSLQIRDQSLSQSWTSVCEGDLGRRGAEVLCRELGCGAPLLQGELSPLGQMFHCEGHESALIDCLRNQTRTNPGTCSGSTLHLSCSEPVRLVGGASRCEGTLEVKYRGEWRGVLIFSAPMDLEAAAAVCQSLDCGSAVSTEERKVSDSSDVWGLRSFCLNKAAVRDCIFTSFSGYDINQEVVCSDLLPSPVVSVSEGVLPPQGGVQLLMGADFQVKCSVEPQYPGGSFQLISPTLNLTLPAVNHSAHFLFTGAGPAHRGSYTCVYLLQVFNHTFSSNSSLQIYLEGALAVGEDLKDTVRLVGGASLCVGAVEVKHKGEWRRVWPAEPWDLEAAAAVCRGLDCGSAVSTEQRRDLNKTDVWRVSSDCVKTKAGRDCVIDGFSDSDAGVEVVCSDAVRLVLGRNLCSGSLQVQDQSVNQSWTSVCEVDLDRRGAEVLCRELGCGAPLLQGELSPLGQMFHCEGHESALMDCPRNQTRTNPGTCSGSTLHLTCSEPVRLVGGASRCEGTVEVKFRGEWRKVTASKLYNPWDLEAAAAVCRGLDCGSAISTEQKPDLHKSFVWSVRPDCVKKAGVRDCVYAGFSDYDDVLEVVCSDSVRLISGQNLCSGSLQIRDLSLSQSWTSLCEGDLDPRGAEVLCRELDYGAPLLQGELFPLGQMFHCEGHESALKDCSQTQTKTNPGTCSGPTLHLTCSVPVRLVGGASRCEGTLELRYRGEWRRVMTFFKQYVPRDPWDLRAAVSVCRDLDCGSAVSTKRRQDLSWSEAWGVDSDCVKKSAVRDCVWGGVPSVDNGLEVVCSDSVRLVSGQSICSGSLQIRDQSLHQSWTSVCEGDLDRRGAEVLCRELGCGAPLLQGELSPLGQMFHCEGHESALRDCPLNQTRTNPGTCSGSTLHLTCSEPVRLAGGASRCEGTVEVKYRGEWRRALAFKNPWGLEAADVFCRGLGCGSAVSMGRRPAFHSVDVWGLDSACMKKKAAVRDCIFEGHSGYGGIQVQTVVCSDILPSPVVSVSGWVWTPQPQGGAQVLMGADFQVKCSVEPRYPGGSFQLISPTVSLTLPAVNHSANFLFTGAGPAHRGSYTCVYLLQMFNHIFSSNSSLLIYLEGHQGSPEESETPRTLHKH